MFNMKQTFRFYKTSDNRWYIDIPYWTGSIAELEMVEGADTMLDRVSENKKECFLELGDEPFAGADLIKLVQDRSLSYGGGDYLMETYKGEVVNHAMWLCSVTNFVFDGLPETIYVGYLGERNFNNPA
jgi:hypothetical protein